MVKKFKWTPTKIIITVLIGAFFLFFLFKVGAFNIIEQFFTTSLPSDIPSSSSSFGGGLG